MSSPSPIVIRSVANALGSVVLLSKLSFVLLPAILPDMVILLSALLSNSSSSSSTDPSSSAQKIFFLPLTSVAADARRKMMEDVDAAVRQYKKAEEFWNDLMGDTEPESELDDVVAPKQSTACSDVVAANQAERNNKRRRCRVEPPRLLAIQDGSAGEPTIEGDGGNGDIGV